MVCLFSPPVFHRTLVLTLLFNIATAVAGPNSEVSPTWAERSGYHLFSEKIDHLTPDEVFPFGRPLVQTAGPIKPVTTNSPRLSVDLKVNLIGQTGLVSRQFLDFMPFRPTGKLKPTYRWQAATGFLVNLPHGFFAQQRTIIDSYPRFDPTSRTKEYRQLDASVEVPLAIVGYRQQEFTAWIGRRWDIWGPGLTGSLVLDAQAPSADGFGLSWTSGRWSARYQAGRLDDVYLESGAVSRYLAGHRLDLALHPNLRLGLSETALVATSGDFPLYLANPLLPWVLSQQEKRGPGETSNILWAIDAVWNPESDWSIYGQFLLDDAMVDLEDRDTYPDQLGVMAGTIWSPGPKPSWRAGLEYSRLWSWAYVHRQPEIRYTSWGESLGHAQGPDSEALTVFAQGDFINSGCKGLVWARWYRKGQTTLDTPQNPVGSTDLPFPIPPVANWWQLGTNTRINLGSESHLSLDLGWNQKSFPSGTLVPESTGIFGPGSRWWLSVHLTLPVFSWGSPL